MVFTILQQIILGIIQGITEWLPLSSSGMLTLALTNLLSITDIGDLVRTALFLHLGTFLAALIYFRKNVKQIFSTLFHYKKQPDDSKKIFNFLLVSTIVSGILGLLIVFTLTSFDSILNITGKTVTFFVGIFLLFTGILQLKIKNSGLKKIKDLKLKDGFVLGLVQGVAVIPGISRSGITISTLLLKKFDDTTSLKLSFLMSLPIVLIGNIILNLEDLMFSPSMLIALLASSIIGLLTIHGLMKLSKKINFGWFALIFAVLMMLSILI